MKKLTLLLLTLTLIYSCKKQEIVNSNANSGNPGFTNSGCTIGRWPAGSLPINFKISSEFTGDFSAGDMVDGLNPLEQTGKVWNNSISGNTFFNLPYPQASNTGYTDLNSFRDNQMGIYKSYNWFSELSSGALAITQYYGVLRSSPSLGSYVELREADIIVNFKDFNGDFTNNSIPYSQDGIYKWDLSTVILHEMGHFLGLCHDSGHTSIMKPYYIKTQRTLFSFDTTKINDLYVRGINTLGGASNMNAISLPDGSEVRGRVELLKNGQCNHYLNGKKVFEHFVKSK